MKYFLLPTHLAFLYSFALSKPVQIATRNNDLGSEIAVYEGDILLRRGRRSAINCESCLWPKSQDGLVKVPINISSDFSVTERSWIVDALQEISTLTCVQFVNRTTETDYVYVERGQSCWSYFGKIGGRQAVGLVKNGCMDKGAIQHEMNHALGFIHEQARSDRDRFVKIMWEHIVAGEQGNFGKVNSKNLGLPYDYSSVMHYGAYDFSSTPGKPTIVPVPDPSIPIGQREGLSNLDVAKINKLYKCNCCSSVLPKSKGSFSSVNYPSPYPNNNNCLWLIRIRRSKIFLQFEAFDLQPSSDCSSDYIKIYNGNSKNSPVLLDRYCGKGPLPSIVASGSTMLIEFASDESVTATGFRASYNRVNCGDTFTDSKGFITSPNYPNKYPKNQACFWVISSPVGYKISLKMLSFELEDSDRCIYDHLLIHDGSRPTSPAVGPYCGTEKVADFTSTGNFVLVEFHSDIVWELPGFVMSYTFDAREFNRLQKINVTNKQGHCVDLPDTGQCTESIPRWYYNPFSEKCDPFTYGGCGGNNNNFEEEEECMKSCSGITKADAIGRRWESFESQSAILSAFEVVIAVLLGICIMVVLAIIGYFFLKNRKNSRRRQPATATNSTLSTTEDTEHLFYSSATKPV